MNQIIKYGSISSIPLYNCSAHQPENWYQKDSVPRPILGLTEGICGIIIEILYFPMLAVMLEKEQFSMSCYKIMTLLAIVDILSILCNCIITGWLAYQGAVYCTFPNLIYISGMAGMGLWCCSCVIAVILITNRLLDLILPNHVSFIFGGKRIFFVLMIPILYGLYFVFFNTPILFTSKYHAWFVDPMIFEGKETEYANIPHIFNNFLVVASTTFLYAVFCWALCSKLKNTDIRSESRSASTQIFFQSAMICAVNMLAAIIYVIMNYIVIPYWMILLGTFMWQLGNGAPVFIYLKFNKTLRNGVLRKIGLKKPKIKGRTNYSSSHVIPAPPSAF
ncbi:hypothetical protein B9Z55_017866 [Caenorhabditis nigoni]|uniref:G-protein coupled receptors family 1 profile domain-containing protein n=1 Tax=Caenorhabditis nigoni TaxID=1611254 RepID=A0A2G5TBL8_9PELO|nr:hypothetical protein B9Z55_017866 [Caenorhabditis nigoni]